MSDDLPLRCWACDQPIVDDAYHDLFEHSYHELCCPECNPPLPLETPDAD